MKKIGKLFFIILLIIFSLYFLTDYIYNDEYEVAYLKRVIDGDTLLVNWYGQEKRVRLLGIDTPESVGEYKDKPQEYGKEASEFVKKNITNKLYLTKDKENKDKYDRLLRYVWTRKPKEEYIDKNMINILLIKNGLAETLFIKPNYKYKDVFEKYEKEAKKKELKIWEKSH